MSNLGFGFPSSTAIGTVYGVGQPTATQGAIGSYYVDVSTGTYYGPKTSAGWGSSPTYANPWAASYTLPLRQLYPNGLQIMPNSQFVVQALYQGLETSGFPISINFCPILTIPANQPNITITMTTSNFGNSAPIPTIAQTLIANTGDSPLVLWQPSTGTVWEIWLTRYSGGSWTGGDGCMYSAMTNGNGSFPNPYGISAAGLSYLGMTVSEGDVARANITGDFGHAMLLVVNDETLPQLPPAVRADGGASVVQDNPPEGALFTWAEGTAMPGGMCLLGQWSFNTIARYGCYAADRSLAGIYFYFENTLDWFAQGGGSFNGVAADPINIALQGQQSYQALASLPINSMVQLVPPALGNPINDLPGAPTSVSCVAGSGSLAVSWTLPTVGTPLTQLIVAYALQSAPTVWQALPGTGAAATTATIYGLTNAAYNVQVWAVNAAGVTPSAIATGTPNAPASSVVQSRAAANVNSLAYSSGVTLHDCLVAFFIGTSTISSVTDSVNGAGSPWTQAFQSQLISGVYISCFVFPNTAAGTPTVTPVGGSTPSTFLAELSGVATSSPVDQFSTSFSASGVKFLFVGPTAALAAANEPMLAFAWANAATALSLPSASHFTSLQSGVSGYLLAGGVAPTALGQSATFSSGVNVEYEMAVVVFKL